MWLLQSRVGVRLVLSVRVLVAESVIVVMVKNGVLFQSVLGEGRGNGHGGAIVLRHYVSVCQITSIVDPPSGWIIRQGRGHDRERCPFQLP